MQKKPFYQVLSSTLQALHNSEKQGNSEWIRRHNAKLRELEQHLPSGAGIDKGARFDKEASKPDIKLVFETSFHHMNEGGYYDGWTEHTVTVTPNFGDVKDLIAEQFIDLVELEVEAY